MNDLISAAMCVQVYIQSLNSAIYEAFQENVMNKKLNKFKPEHIESFSISLGELMEANIKVLKNEIKKTTDKEREIKEKPELSLQSEGIENLKERLMR